MHNSYLTSSDFEKMLDLVLHLSSYKDDYCLHVLQCLHEHLGYEHMSFLQVDSENNFINPITFNIDSSLCKSYERYYKYVDIFFHHQKIVPNKKFMSIPDLMSFSDYEKTEYYNDFLRTDNLYYQIAIPLKANNNCIGGIGIFKPKSDGDFSPKDFALMTYLSEHISTHFNNFKQYKTKEDSTSLLIKKDLPLTKREIEIALLVKQGLSNEEISNTLHISFHTVKTHLEHIYRKLDISNRASMLHCLDQYKIR